MNELLESHDPEMERRFRDLVSRCAPEADDGRLYRIVADRYSEPHRRYHTLDHIRHCLAQLDQVRHLADDPDAMELAIWFHDVIYDPAMDDNELRSALFFDAHLGVHLPGGRAARVHRLIMYTEHPSEPDDGDARLMVDIDLSSFGLSWEEFMRDTNAIQEELAHLPEEQFIAGKLKFLGCLLSRPRFYLTDCFHDRLEGQARSNIERHIHDIETRV